MRSPTCLLDSRVYSPENFRSTVQKDFYNNIGQKLLCALQRGQPIQKAGASAQRGPSRFGQARCVVRQATSNVCRINSIVCWTASGSAGGPPCQKMTDDVHNPAVNWYSFHNRDGLVRRKDAFCPDVGGRCRRTNICARSAGRSHSCERWRNATCRPPARNAARVLPVSS